MASCGKDLTFEQVLRMTRKVCETKHYRLTFTPIPYSPLLFRGEELEEAQ